MYFPAFSVSHNLTQVPLGHCRPDVGCFPPHDLRRVCQPHEREGQRQRFWVCYAGREREQRQGEESREGRISIEFLLHGGAEHNSRGKASIAISNAPMSRTDGRRERRTRTWTDCLGFVRKDRARGNHGGCGLYAA